MEIETLKNIEKIKILVFGDYIVDKYITGNVSRISPEAPVPIIEVHSKKSKLGGAGNVVNNIVSLGAQVRAIGCIGKDNEGRFIINDFKSNKVDVSHMGVYTDTETITKTRIVSNNQQFLRFDEEKIKPISEKYYLYLKKNIVKVLSGIDAVIISDYNKGSVTEEAAKLLIKTAKNVGIPLIVDPKGKNYDKYKGATIITPNTKELGDVLNKKIITEDDILLGGLELCKQTNIDYLLLTRSEKGISLFKKGENIKHDFPAVARDIIDVTGAGDTVVAISSILMALKFKIDDICKIANIAASIVITKFGTSALSLNELISNISDSGEFKLINSGTAKYIIGALKEKSKKIVFTNGTFDLLHSGHLYSFEQAKKFGDVLIVAINSDSSVRRYKGDLRPIISEDDRIKMICSLEIVDYVILMEEDNPSKIIELIKPDICVKGVDWKNKIIPEKEIIDEYGGKLKFIKLYQNISTTNIINKILEAYGSKNE